MSGPFKLKYKNSAFPFKEDDKKKKELTPEQQKEIINKVKKQIRQTEHEINWRQMRGLEWDEMQKIQKA